MKTNFFLGILFFILFAQFSTESISIHLVKNENKKENIPVNLKPQPTEEKQATFSKELLEEMESEFSSMKSKSEKVEIQKDFEFKNEKQENEPKSWLRSMGSKISKAQEYISHKMAKGKESTKKSFKSLISKLKSTLSKASFNYELQKKSLHSTFSNLIQNAKKLFEKEPDVQMDMSENENELVIALNTPGVSKNDVKIILENKNGKDVLIISGKFPKFKKQEILGEEKSILKERKAGNFKREIELKIKVKQDRIFASLENGILLIQIPKENSKFNVKIN
jgi:HSP20 family protein